MLATNHLVNRSVKEVFNGKTTSYLVKDLKVKNEEAALMTDHVFTQTTSTELHENETTTTKINNESPSLSKQRAFIEKRDSFQKTIVAPNRQQHCTLDSAYYYTDDHTKTQNEYQH